MYSYHRNTIATIWHMQGKLATVLMQQFFFSKCSRKNEAGVWLKCYLLSKMHFKNLWLVLLKSKFTLSQIHFNGGSPIAGLGNTRGGGFVFLKHYHCQCTCWLYYVASYPSQPCSVNMFVRPFDFVLIFVSQHFIFLTALGTWHFIIVYMYIQQVVIWHWPLLMLSCSYQSLFFFLVGLMSYFSESEACGWTKQTVWMFDERGEKKKKALIHPFVLNLTLDM